MLHANDEWPDMMEAANSGTYGHKLLDSFYKVLAAGKSRTEAYATSILLEPDEACPIKAENRAIVREKFEMYNYTYAHSDLFPQDPSTVEVGFSHKLCERTDRVYILEGRIDIYGARMNNGSGLPTSFTDHKFQFKKRELYSKRIQFRNYGLVCYEQTGLNHQGLVNYIRLTKKTDGETFLQRPITFLPGEHEWWKGELIKVYDRVAEQIQRVENCPNSETYEPEWSSCEGKYGNCMYTKICETPNIARQEHTIENFYNIGKEWKPW